MKIAISAKSANLKGNITDIFGRCPYFIIVETKNKKIVKTKAIKNTGAEQTTGAGIATAKLLAQNNIDAVITGNIGPRALDVLKQFKIRIFNKTGNIKKTYNQ